MIGYFVRRFIYMFFMLLAISLVAFIVIQLPPGDYLTTYIMQLESRGELVTEAEVAMLKKQYDLDLPMTVRYFKWLWKMINGDWGVSFNWNQPVLDLIAERLPVTIAISIFALIFTYAVAVPIGIYSATHQYSLADYGFSVLGFIGLAVPNFILALLLMFVFYKVFNVSIGGLFSQEYLLAPWSWAKLVDMLKHLPVPIIAIGLAGTAGLIRVMRGVLLDELQKQYVVTARAKGVAEGKLLFKYPVRVSLNPIVSTIGYTLPLIVSGQTITAVVLSLPTVGPLLLGALINQDTYLAGSTVMLLSFLVILGTFISDLLLAAIDPRIRFERKAR